MQKMRSRVAYFIGIAILSVASSIGAAERLEKSVSPGSLQILESTPQFLHIQAKIPAEVFEFENSLEAAEAIPGFATITQNDKPEVPFISRNLLIPPTGGVRLANVKADSRLERTLRSVVTGLDANNAMQTLLETGDDGFWPEQKVIIGEPAIMRGYRIVTVTMFPEQVNLATGEVRHNDNFDFRLEYQGDEVNPVEDAARPRPSRYAYKLLNSLVDNPPPPPRDNELSGSYLYIIPNHEGAIDAMQPLLEWRRRQGHKVVVTIVANNANQNVIAPIIRDAYRAEPPVEFVTLVGDASRGEFNIPAYSQQGDWGYTLQEGNDALADLAIGRLSCRTTAELNTIVHKLITYEADPFDGNEEWFLHGGVVAGSSINGISEVFVAKYVRKELYNLGFSEVRGYFWPENGDARGEQPFLAEWFRWGISVLHYRAFHLMNNLNVNVIDNLPGIDGRWPAVLAISCETGNFTQQTDGHTEHFLRARFGAVGAIGTATPNTNVKYNNLVAGGVWKGIYKDDLFAFGWGLNAGKFELWRAYSGFDNNFLTHMEWNNLMGDAGTHLWTGLPTRIEVDHPATLAIGQSHYAVSVTNDDEDGGPVEAALVCLYKGDELHEIAYTNADGIAEFSFDPNAMSEGEILVTVTKHNVRPYLGSADVVERVEFLGVDDWWIEDGDGDGLLNPGEVVELTFAVVNSGSDQIDGRIGIKIASMSPWVDVVADTIYLGEAPAPGESIEVNHQISVTPDCPDLVKHRLEITLFVGNRRWVSAIEPVSGATAITVGALQVEGGGILNPGDIRNISYSLSNFGSIPSVGFTATLISRDRDLTVHQNQASYDGLDIGDTQWEISQPFRISTNNNIVPGRQFPLEMQIDFDDNTSTTASAMITVGRPGLRDPFGPDKYGYLCFDSYDTSWAMAPDYDWIEIDPNAQRRDFEGTRINITDTGDNDDKSRMIELPFAFKYYGEEFDQITVCTNGWAAFGDQSELADFRKTHVGQALGPSAQLCPWWDNLVTPNGSGIYYYYDEAGGKFIIEWSGMKRLLENDRQGATETFQIILYAQSSLPTPSGDGVITFQYLDITNENRPAHNDLPFCMIGIGNLEDDGGLEYTYWAQYPAGAREIADRMAITFSPTLQVLSGVAKGRVTDLETGRGASGVTVKANRRGRTVTDNAGFYYLDLAIGEGYILTAEGQGWNEQSREGIAIEHNDTVTVDFSLTHPEFSIPANDIERTLDAGEAELIELQMHNEGNGPLRWEAEKIVEGEGEPIGHRRFSFPAARRAGDLGLVGVAHVGDRFYATGRYDGRTPLLYEFNERGALVDSFPQPGVLMAPMPDLAWDGELLWGAGGRNIYGFDLHGRIQRQFIGPYAENVGIAWDPVRELLWVSGSQRNNGIYGCNRAGQVFSVLSQRGFQITGLGYWPNDPDDFPLYVFHTANDSLNNPRSLLHKYSLAGRSDTMYVSEFIPNEPEAPMGLDISPDYAVYDWSMVVLKDDMQNNHGGDHIDVYQLGIVTTWLGLRQESGLILADSSSQFIIELNTAGLDSGTVTGDVIITHNAAGERLVIPVSLRVIGLEVHDGSDILPVNAALLSAYPSPFNASFRVAYELPAAGNIDLALYDLHGRMLTRLANDFKQAGRHELTFDATDLPSGVYAVQFKAGGVTHRMKVVCIK